MRFFPLAIAEMKGEGVCVAGLDINAGRWIRPVVIGYRCLFAEQARLFEPNCIHELALGAVQPRSGEVDPMGYHSEDRVLLEVEDRSQPVSPVEKLGILDGGCDRDLALAVSTGRRSLFLVEPQSFQYKVDDYGNPRFTFSSTLPDTSGQGPSPFLDELRVGVSRWGAKCTCPRWVDFATGRWAKRAVDEGMFEEACSGARFYMILSLSALHESRYWLIVAGVHVVGEDRIWL